MDIDIRRWPVLCDDCLVSPSQRLMDQPSPGLDSACIDGNFVTAPAWPAHSAWIRAFLEVLGRPVAV